MTVNRERMELWAQALESEQYVQCARQLRIQLRGPESGDIVATWHCALGVGMAVAQAHGVQVLPWDWKDSQLPEVVKNWYGLDSVNPYLDIETETIAVGTVIGANDILKLPFWDIAQLLRAKYVKEEEQ